jgi:mannose-6-phosphate isomerase-like protein (cupin superfamily)
MNKKWGSYEVLGKGKNWKVKILTINPKCFTSLQYHKFRDEIWIFPNKKCKYIKAKKWHQLNNKLNSKSLIVIEIQIGKCFEKDIIRKNK